VTTESGVRPDYPDWSVVAQPYAHLTDPAGAAERWVVTLVVGYDPATTNGTATSPLQAANAALALTRGAGGRGTVWHVYDRKTQQAHEFEQHEFEDRDDDQEDES
jgi:hypothetical protein